MSARLAALYALRDRVDAAIIAEGGRVRRRALLRPLSSVRPALEPEPLEEPDPILPATLESIVSAVCDRYAMSEHTLRNARNREACDARQIAWVVMRWEGHTASRIAQEFERDHSSVCSGVKRAEGLPALRDVARAIQADVQNNFARTA